MFELIEHPDFPLLSTCRIQCLNYYGIQPNTWHALSRALGYHFTVGELVERYETDFTAIHGIGSTRACDLAAVLATSGYPSPLEVAT